MTKKELQAKYKLPSKICFEPISHCILNCEFCPLQQLEWWKYRRKGTMSFYEFKKIIDDVSWFLESAIFSGGEPILNPNIFNMLAYCNEKNIRTFLATNGILLSMKDNIKRLIDNPPSVVEVALESASKGPYESTRRHKNKSEGDHNTVIKVIENLVEAKRASGQKLPTISAVMVVTKKNVKEIDKFWKLVKSLGVDRANTKALGVWPEGIYIPGYDEKMKSEYLVQNHKISRHKIDKKGNITFTRKKNSCIVVKTKGTYIASGGEVLPCMYILTRTPIMGNAVDTNFVDIWNSDKYKATRKKMVSTEGLSPLCRRCIGGYRPGETRIFNRR